MVRYLLICMTSLVGCPSQSICSHSLSHKSFRGPSLTFRSKIAKMIEYNAIGEVFRVEVEDDEKFTGK